MNQAVAAFNDLLDNLLSRAGKRTRVDCFKLARKMGFIVAKSNRIEGSNAQVVQVNGRWKITVNSFDPREVQHFLVAHEILELLFPECSQKEELCKMGASFLLIPQGQFETACLKSDGNLYTLKEHFAFLSWEALAFRSLAVKPGIITLFDNGQLTARVASKGLSYGSDLFPMERKVFEAILRQGGRQQKKEKAMDVRGWSVCERGWERIILRTEVTSPGGRSRQKSGLSP